MAVIIKEMQKPQYCFLCQFSFRVDNEHVACSFHPTENAVTDGESIPDHCPIEDVQVV